MLVFVMAYKRTLVCLANSWKFDGSCVAGRDWVTKEHGWIRPVGPRETASVLTAERTFANGEEVAVLDVVEIEFLQPTPHLHQTENHLFNNAARWERVGEISWDDVGACTEEVGGPLWINGSHSSQGLNDKVAAAALAALTRSLYLVEPANLRIVVRASGKRRASFQLEGSHYNLAVTDPWLGQAFPSNNPGIFAVEGARLCVSLPHAMTSGFGAGFAYKLVATVITPARAGE
jgi:hypothetical protein